LSRLSRQCISQEDGFTDGETRRIVKGWTVAEAGRKRDPREASPGGTLSGRAQPLSVADVHAILPPLSQNPHAVRDTPEKVLEVAIGREVRAFRKKLGITVADLAAGTGLSLGMLSKIENGITSPSLTTLQVLSRALGVPVTAFFRRYEEERSAVFVKAGEGLEIERRGTRAGHQYNLLGHVGAKASGVVVEPYLITLSETSDVFPTFQHEGMEFLYMLEGEVVYRHGSNLFRMLPGDSLFFDADAPHGPEELTRLPIRYLSIISYPQGGGGT
jgi:transcriptional regulator with XRE-family HTH domain